MQPYIEVIFCWDEYVQPIRMRMAFGEMELRLGEYDPIDWNVQRDANGTELIRFPNTSEEKARHIFRNREIVAKKLSAAVMRALGARDTDNGYRFPPSHPGPSP